MPKWTLWMSDAEPEEQGSFCDNESKHEYVNCSDLTANDARQSAENAGYEVYHLDEPYDGSSRHDSPSLEDRHNLYYSERDDQNSQMPAKYEPGR